MHNSGPVNTLSLFARLELAGGGHQRAGPALLLEGSWPAEASPLVRSSLDDAIDARFGWIDEEASRLAERLAEATPQDHERHDPLGSIPPAWLNALSLRYYLVKLLRPVAYFTEVRPLRPEDRLRLFAARRRDEDYAHVIQSLCRLAGARLDVCWIDRSSRPNQVFPNNGRWRRAAARIARRLTLRRNASASAPRVVTCGNPKLLYPIARELLRRDARVWWLCDRFAVRAWLRWWTAGVKQLVCDSDRGRVNRLVQPTTARLECRGVSLAPPVFRWIAARLKTHGPRQTRAVEQIDAHFRRIGPQALILDEDATPMARAAVAVARRYGAPSFVVQHGAPCCRFGFAPLAADRIFAWGRSSERQLCDWGVPAERIQTSGSPRHGRLRRVLGHRASRPAKRGAPRILLLLTVPPRDGRPDAVTLHLTRRSYAGAVRAAVAAVAAIPGARLTVKRHPRAPDETVVRAVLDAYPSLSSRVVCRGPLERWLRRADCVLSLLSSAGVDATLAGVPVIGLLPDGSGDVLPHDGWGMLGTARTEAQLQALLARALHADEPLATRSVSGAFADLDGRSAVQIAQAVLTAIADSAPDPGLPLAAFTPLSF
ncbi:MAG: hypothetical protein ACYTG0_24125 [Planctomycetota bacterium]